MHKSRSALQLFPQSLFKDTNVCTLYKHIAFLDILMKWNAFSFNMQYCSMCFSHHVSLLYLVHICKHTICHIILFPFWPFIFHSAIRISSPVWRCILILYMWNTNFNLAHINISSSNIGKYIYSIKLYESTGYLQLR